MTRSKYKETVVFGLVLTLVTWGFLAVLVFEQNAVLFPDEWPFHVKTIITMFISYFCTVGAFVFAKLIKVTFIGQKETSGLENQS